MSYDDCRLEDEACPRCGEYQVHFRSCDQIGCEDGWCDEHDDDPINFAPGQEYAMCRECYGFGVLRWCRACGLDLNWEAYKKEIAG